MAVKYGPKAAITAAPLDFKGWPKDRAGRRIKFVETYGVVTKGVGAGKAFKLRTWQKSIIRGAYADGIRQALVTIPRANGKSALAAALAVAELFVGGESPEVLVVASDQRQARIIYNLAKRMIELNPELAERVHIYSDRIETPHNNGTMHALPADPAALHGWDPSLCLVDEVAQVTPEVWEAITSVSGKRPESLTLAIGTPADSEDSVMWRLVEHGREGLDPSFYLREYSAPAGCETDDRAAWAAANPALGDFLSADGLESVRATLREPVFRQLRLGQWVEGVSTWLPFGAWAKCADDTKRPGPGTRICLGFDGSSSGDDTAIVAATVEPVPHLWLAGHWHNADGSKTWRVPRDEVDQTIRELFETYDVVELACDPWGYRSEIERWAAEYGAKRVTEFNTAFRIRQAKAVDRMFQAVMGRKLTHDGGTVLAAHMAHATAVATPQGDVLEKPKRMSPKKIDAAIAAVIAHDRAAFHASQKTARKRRRSASFN